MTDNHITDNYISAGHFPEDNTGELSMRIEVTRRYFSKHYPHVYMGDITDRIIIDYLTRDYIISLKTIEQKMDAFYDYLLSQNLVDVEE